MCGFDGVAFRGTRLHIEGDRHGAHDILKMDGGMIFLSYFELQDEVPGLDDEEPVHGYCTGALE